MIITTTAIAFISSSLGLGFCGVLFLKAAKKNGGFRVGNSLSFLLLGLIFSNAIQHAIMGFGHLFFVESLIVLHVVIILTSIFLALAAAFGIYLIFYLFSPRISPWPATLITALYGIFVVIATAVIPFSPFIDAGGGVDWNFPEWFEIVLYVLIFLNIGTLLAVFAVNFAKSTDRRVKAVSLVIVLITLLGLVNIFLRFIFLPDTVGPARTRFFDITLATIGLISIVGLSIIPLIRKRASNKK